MLMSGTLRRLLIAGTCLCVCGAPFQPTRVGSCEGGQCAGSDVKSADGEHVMLDVGEGGGGAGPHGRPEGIEPVTQAGNGGSPDGRSGPGEAGGEARSSHSTPEVGERQAEDLPAEREPTGGRKPDMDAPARSSGLTTPQLENNQQSSQGGFSDSLQDPEANLASSPEPPNPSASFWTHTSLSPIPPLVFVTPRTATPLAIWGRDGATMSSLPVPFLPEIGPREDGPESLWTEAARPGGADTPIPLSQDEATEATMSSEALPLIFEPFEDVTPEGGAAAVVAAVTMVPGNAQLPGAMATGGLPLSDLDQLVTVETDSDGPSHAPPVLMPDWTSPWQTSGAEILEPISSSGPSASQRQVGTEPEDQSEKAAARTPNLEENLSSTGPSLSSFQHAMTTVTMATHHPMHKSRSGLEEMESEEEQDEDEEDENSEESVEEESEEDLTETPKTSSTQPPYSLIPPPPVWVQRNQGLMRSWVELIREKISVVEGL